MVTTYPEPHEFDFDFLSPSDEVSFQQQPLPTGTTLSLSDSSVGRGTPSSDTRSGSTDLVRMSAAKRRLERRGHTKSRAGCYNCKRRRIKVFFLIRSMAVTVEADRKYSAKRHILLVGIVSRRA